MHQLPMLDLAPWCCVTRQDYWHHWSDVLAGFILGCLIAYTFYRQQFPPLDSRAAGEAFAATSLPGGALGDSAGGGSEVELPFSAPLQTYNGGGGGRGRGGSGYSPLDSAADRLAAVNAERGEQLPV